MSNDNPNEPTAPVTGGSWQGQSPYPPPQSPGGYYGQQGSSAYPPPPQPVTHSLYQSPNQYSTPSPPQYSTQYSTPSPTQAYPVTEPAARAKVPGWMWPAVALMALVLGLTGGALAGALVAGDGGGVAGDVFRVERRTAPPLPADNGSIAAVAEKVLPSSVQIVAEFKGEAQGATGSGFVIDESGHVITNNHVVAQADEDNGPIEIIDHKGKHMKATVVGRSTVYDIAVLKAEEAKTLKPVAIGSADQMRVGETVIAIGSPLGLSASVTSGIVSALNRPVTTGENENDNSYINAVQTDAAINPGNSGGPLVNLQGEVVGVNSAIASLGSSLAGDQGGNIGVGFAIPIEQVQVTTAQILKTGKAQYPVIGANVRGNADARTAPSSSRSRPGRRPRTPTSRRGT